ncbi:MAG: hypothetical protein MUQ30_16295 [Anaerolineae bacterium]|nr:hypothetical protein [Anaerolineae bacterium]
MDPAWRLECSGDYGWTACSSLPVLGTAVGHADLPAFATLLLSSISGVSMLKMRADDR